MIKSHTKVNVALGYHFYLLLPTWRRCTHLLLFLWSQQVGAQSIHPSHLIPSHLISSIQSRGSRNNPKEGGINLSSSRSSSRLISSHLIPSRPLSTPWCFHQTARSNFFLFFPFPPTEQEQCRKGPNKLLPNPERKGYIVRQKTPRKSPISPIPVQSISQ